VYSFGIPDNNDSGLGAFGIDIHGHDELELEPLLCNSTSDSPQSNVKTDKGQNSNVKASSSIDIEVAAS
jgi:hypothetical protein